MGLLYLFICRSTVICECSGLLPGAKQSRRGDNDPPHLAPRLEYRAILYSLLSPMARHGMDFTFMDIYIKTQVVILRHIVIYVDLTL
jgi:hypothetical protein